MSEELLRGIEEYTEFLTPTTELMDELNHESDEDHDMILSFDEGSKRRFSLSEGGSRIFKDFTTANVTIDYTTNKRQRVSISPKPASAPVTMIYQNSPSVMRTPAVQTTPIISNVSTPGSARSFSSPLDNKDNIFNTPYRQLGLSPNTAESPAERIQLEQASTNLPTPKTYHQSNLHESPVHPKEMVDQEMKDEPISHYDTRPTPPKESDLITVNRHDYTVLNEIGRGNTGRVFQVLSHTYGEVFALKWIDTQREEDRNEVLNEIQMLNSLKDHDRIVKLLDYDVQSTIIYMILECGEIDLFNLIRAQLHEKWDISFIRYYWKQMLEAVSVVHQRIIVHSDLKPANFVVVKGWLKLIDFGIAMKSADDTTSVHRVGQFGTVDYMAPETLVNNGNNETLKHGRSSDIWSLGCMLYEFVYGETPFQRLPLAQKVINIPNPEYEISFPSTIKRGKDETTIPSSLVELLKKCLDRNPFLRPTISDLLKDPFLNTC